jgi:hypothetical protein
MTDPRTAASLHRILREAVAGGAPQVRLPPGEHLICGDWLPERFGHVSNNDHGLKRVLLDVDGARGLVLDGQGATLRCFGNVLPIRVGRSRDITIRNLTIDWHRPFFTQAVVTDSGPGWLSFAFEPDRYPLRVDGGRLVAHDGFGWQTDMLWNLLPFDPRRREVSTGIENWHLSRWHRAQALGQDGIRIEAAFSETYAAGTPIVLMHGNRVAPGIWIEDSQQVTVQDVTIHHAPAMGVIAQLSRDVTLERVRVVPSGDRLYSTWVDAAHFVDCDGATRLLDCELRGQFDDAANIHARFALVVDRPGPRAARLRYMHPQQFGPPAATPGSGFAFHRRDNLARVLVTTILTSQTVNQEYHDVTLAHELPTGEGELIGARFDPASTIEVRGCRLGANRGRGLLLNMEHRILVENNHLHVSGRAIESVPDACYWWEGSPAQEMTIRGNTFEDCGFGPCGDDLIYLGPDWPAGAAPCPVLRNIRVVDNTIIRHRGRLLRAQGVDGLTVTGNRIADSTRYPVIPAVPPVELGEGMGRAVVSA